MCTNCEYLVLPNSGGTGGVIRYGTNMQGLDMGLVRESCINLYFIPLFRFVSSLQVLEFVVFFLYMCTNCEYLVLPNSGGTGGVIRYGTNMQGPDVGLVREAHDRIGILNLITSGYVLSLWFFLHHSFTCYVMLQSPVHSNRPGIIVNNV